jgi:hypothetical protein
MTNNQTIDGMSLLPCPFCGCAGKFVPADYVRDDLSPWPVVECTNQQCNAWVPVESWQKRTGFDYSSHSLNDTITRLQARIAELESGRGEAVAHRVVFNDGEKGQWHEGPPSGADDDDVNAGIIRAIERAYASPPAPVAVVLPTQEDFKEAFCSSRYVDADQASDLAEIAVKEVRRLNEAKR